MKPIIVWAVQKKNGKLLQTEDTRVPRLYGTRFAAKRSAEFGYDRKPVKVRIEVVG